MDANANNVLSTDNIHHHTRTGSHYPTNLRRNDDDPMIDVEDHVNINNSSSSSDEDEDEDEDEYDTDDDHYIDDPSNRLLRKVRSIYQCMTFPIVPCLFLTILSYLYFLLTAFLLDPIIMMITSMSTPTTTVGTNIITHIQNMSELMEEDTPLSSIITTTTSTPCAQPLHVYAYISIMVVLYLYYHRTVRMWILTTQRLPFGTSSLPYSNQNHNPNDSNQRRVPTVLVQQRYDQIVYSLIIVYICVGLSFVQSCRNTDSSSSSSSNHRRFTTGGRYPYDDDDILSDEKDDDIHWRDNVSSSSLTALPTCQETCPYMIQALTIYISMIELTIMAYIIPMLCLPCIYFYVLRHGPYDHHRPVTLPPPQQQPPPPHPHLDIDDDDENYVDRNHTDEHNRNHSSRYMMDPDTFVRILQTGINTTTGRNRNSTTSTTAATTITTMDRRRGISSSPPPQTWLDRFHTITHPFLFFSHYYYYYSHEEEDTNHIVRPNATAHTNHRYYSYYHRNSKIRVQDIMDQLDVVQLTKRRKVNVTNNNNITAVPSAIPITIDNGHDDTTDVYDIVVVGSDDLKHEPSSYTSKNTSIAVFNSTAIECCICMNEFMVSPSLDMEQNCSIEDNNNHVKIVRTPLCHHLFHQHCIRNWIVGGPWWDERNTSSDRNTHHDDDNNNDESTTGTMTTTTTTTTRLLPSVSQPSQQQRHRNRRSPPSVAYRTTCPLCRTHLYRSSEQSQHQPHTYYGSMS